MPATPCSGICERLPPTLRSFRSRHDRRCRRVRAHHPGPGALRRPGRAGRAAQRALRRLRRTRDDQLVGRARRLVRRRPPHLAGRVQRRPRYSITFHVPVRGTGEIAVHFWAEKLGTTSADYRFRVTSTDDQIVYAEGRRVIINLDPATMRPHPWTEEGRRLATRLLRPSI